MSIEHPLVHIRVTVNVGSMRRGQELQLPLTEHIEGLSLAGYIQVLGHVAPGVPPVADTETSEATSRPRRRKSKEVSGGGSTGSP